MRISSAQRPRVTPRRPRHPATTEKSSLWWSPIPQAASPAARRNSPYPPPRWRANTDVVTFHNDVARTGLNSTETMLTPGNVNVHTLRPAAQSPRRWKSGRRAAVSFRTHDQWRGSRCGLRRKRKTTASTLSIPTPARFSGRTPSQIWRRPTKPPATTEDAARPAQEIGITATPVIDRKAGPNGTMFLVTMSLDIQGMHHQRLHALDITTGAEMLNGPTEIQATYPGSGTANTGGTMVFLPSGLQGTRRALAHERQHLYGLRLAL